MKQLKEYLKWIIWLVIFTQYDWTIDVEELIDEILATKGPATYMYTDGLTEGNWEQVITDSSVGEGSSLAPSPDIFLFNTRVCSVLSMTSQVTWH